MFVIICDNKIIIISAIIIKMKIRIFIVLQQFTEDVDFKF